ncbi:MAG TPA: peptidoglycan editing factor PgeF [Vicinamibacterales bacterium]
MLLPQPNGEFEWVQEPWGAALVCRPMGAVAHHCFSTRGLELEGIRADGVPRWQDLANTMGVGLESLVRMHQVHGADVFEAGRVNAVGRGSPEPHTGKSLPTAFSFDSCPDADIAITDDPAVAVSVKAADCVPILLADRRTGAVAAIHAGWKGTAAGAAIVAVRALTLRYGTNPEDVIAAVGPSIGPCCYEVGPDLAAQFSSHPEAPTWFSRAEKPHLDLWRATRDQLERAGVPPGQIHVCALCTFDHAAVFHSYRRDGKGAGRLVAAVRSAAGRTP